MAAGAFLRPADGVVHPVGPEHVLAEHRQPVRVLHEPREHDLPRKGGGTQSPEARDISEGHSETQRERLDHLIGSTANFES